MPTVGWKLNCTDRQELLLRFRPKWPDIIADHVTLWSRSYEKTDLPEQTCGEIVGHVDDGRGLEALVVRIGGTTARPDGSFYHITWSLDRSAGRRPVESNDLLAQQSWSEISPPLPIRLVPAVLS